MVTHKGSWRRGVAVIEPSVFVVNESFSKNETDFDLIAIVYLCYSLSYLLRSQFSFVKSSREIFQPSEDRKSTRLNSSHSQQSRMPSSA